MSLKNFMRRILALALLGIALGFAGRLWYFAKDGFSVNRLRFPSIEESDASARHRAISEALYKGPYRYLGKGRQCYAFESLDGRIVLKFLRCDWYKLSFFWKAMPSSYFARIKRPIFKRRSEKRLRELESFRISSEELSEYTGVFYYHFAKTEHLPKCCEIRDRMGRSFQIDLNKAVFILQKKKPLMMPQFLQALRSGKIDEAKRILRAFLDILSAKARLGIFDRDASFLENFGYADGKATQIDIGSFYRKPHLPPEQVYEQAMHEGVRTMRLWLGQLDADMLNRFENMFDEMMISKG